MNTVAIQVQTLDRDILHKVAIKIKEQKQLAVKRYRSATGPQFGVVAGDILFVMPLAVYGFLRNGECLPLPTYTELPIQHERVPVEPAINPKMLTNRYYSVEAEA